MPKHNKDKEDNQKTFTSKFHPSMSVMYKTELQKRRDKRVTLQKKAGKNKYSAQNEEGQAVNLNGHYAFVTKTDGKIVAWPKSATAHNDTCHFALSDFAQQVTYAGEVIFTPYKKSKPKYARCKEHNNASGTYKPEAAYDSQSGFPTNTFVMPTFSY